MFVSAVDATGGFCHLWTEPELLSQTYIELFLLIIENVFKRFYPLNLC